VAKHYFNDLGCKPAQVTNVDCPPGNGDDVIIYWDDGAVAIKPMLFDPDETDPELTGEYFEMFPNDPETFGPHTPPDYFRSPLEMQ